MHYFTDKMLKTPLLDIYQNVKTSIKYQIKLSNRFFKLFDNSEFRYKYFILEINV